MLSEDDFKMRSLEAGSNLFVQLEIWKGGKTRETVEAEEVEVKVVEVAAAVEVLLLVVIVVSAGVVV